MSGSRRRRSAWRLGAILAALGLLAAGFWAGRTVVQPSLPHDSEPAPQLYEVTEGTVGQSLSYSARATWGAGPTVVSPAAGTLTSVMLPDDGSVASGDVLYTVDLQPTIAIDGAIPAFRDLTLRTKGEDVAQLQTFLIGEGFLAGAADGVFGPATAAAVRGWQRESGTDVDGVVDLGEIVFMSLPARAYLADGVGVGAVVSQGMAVLETVVGSPSFVLRPATDDSVRTAVEGLQVTILLDGAELTGITGVASRLQDGSVVIPVESSDAPLCDEECRAALPIPGPVELSAELIIAPEQTGPVVPVSAIRTDPGGQSQVTMGDGVPRSVEILVSYGGLAVVDGVHVGDTVRLFGDE